MAYCTALQCLYVQLLVVTGSVIIKWDLYNVMKIENVTSNLSPQINPHYRGSAAYTAYDDEPGKGTNILWLANSNRDVALHGRQGKRTSC